MILYSTDAPEINTTVCFCFSSLLLAFYFSTPMIRLLLFLSVHVNAAPFCVRPTPESCHGEWHEMVEMIGSDSPFHNISAGTYLVPSFVDLNKDGKLDMIIGNKDGLILYFLNTGTPTNPSFTQKIADSPFNGIDVGTRAASFLVDLDRDGDYDMVVGNEDGVLKYFQNTGSPTSAAFEVQTGASNPFRNVSVGTFAYPFILSTKDELSFEAYIGNGAGMIWYYKSIGVGSTFVFKLQTGDDNALDGIDVGNNAAPLAMDVDNDGDIDVYVGNGDGKIPFFQNTGSLMNPVYTQMIGNDNNLNGVGIAVEGFAAPVSVDIDSDGHLDVLIGNEKGQLLFYKNFDAPSSSPTFLKLKGSDNPFNSVDDNPVDVVDVFENSVPTAFDIDNDGDIDMLIGVNVIDPDGDTGRVYYFKNVGNSVNPLYEEQKGINNPFNFLLGPLPAPESLDIDSDGDVDVVLGKKDGKIAYFENIGSPMSSLFTEQIGAANVFVSIDVGDNASPFAADMDNDEDFDLFIGNAAGQIFFFKNTGTKTLPTFTEQIGSANPFNGISLGTDAAPFGIDFDVDGDIDMFVGNGQGKIRYFQNTGSKTNAIFTLQSEKNNPFSVIDVGDSATPFGIDVNNMYIGNLEGQLLAFSRSRCVPTPRCSGRGTCVYSSSGSTCQCIESESDGPHCESCPVGKIEGQYKAGQNLDIIIPPRCKSCPAGYWSDQLGFDVSAKCKACEAARLRLPTVFLVCLDKNLVLVLASAIAVIWASMVIKIQE